MGIDVQAQRLFESCCEWEDMLKGGRGPIFGRFIVLGFEQGSGVAIKKWFDMLQTKAKRYFPTRIIKLPAGSGRQAAGEGKVRIEALAGPYSAGEIWHHISLKGGGLESGLLRYPGLPDDCPDALAMGQYIAQHGAHPGEERGPKYKSEQEVLSEEIERRLAERTRPAGQTVRWR
jgi:hypothetical protein